MPEQSAYDPKLDALIWGAEAIGAASNRTMRQTYHLLEQGLLPADKVGGTWCTTLRRLLTPRPPVEVKARMKPEGKREARSRRGAK